MLSPLDAVRAVRDVRRSAGKQREAEEFCADMARREAKNFYWGFISLPRDRRMAIYALYDFARQVDDDVDGAPNAALVPDRLLAQRRRITRCVHGQSEDPVMHVLSRAVRRFQIPESELQALIEGVERDLGTHRYETWDALREYCTLVASVVGRMCVRIFGFEDPRALQYADDLGIALQLTNILRDVREDAQMGRIYVPREDLERFGVREATLMDGIPGPGWEQLIAFETRRARLHFDSGYEVLQYIPRRAAACVQTMAGIYERILEKIEQDPWLPLRTRATLSNREKLHVVLSSWLRPA